MTKVLFKAIKLSLFITVITIINNLLQPYYINNIALAQMDNSIDSSFWMTVYQTIYGYKYLIYLIIFLVAFKKEIKLGITYITNKLKNKVN